MKNWLFVSSVCVFVLGSTARPALAQTPAPATPWNVGDVFVAVGAPSGAAHGGAYRVLSPQGALKNEPALAVVMDQTTGCAVDVASGDLYTTGFWNMSMSRFSGPLAGM